MDLSRPARGTDIPIRIVAIPEQQVPITVVTHLGQSRDNDAVISVEVFEHLPNLLAALRDINRTCVSEDCSYLPRASVRRNATRYISPARPSRAAFSMNWCGQPGLNRCTVLAPRTILLHHKRREPTPFDWLYAIALIAGRVAHKIPVKLWRALSARNPVRQPDLP